MLFFAGAATLVALLIAAAIWTIVQFKHASEKRVLSASLVLTKSLEQTMESQIDSINFALLVSANEIGQQLSAKKINSDSIHQFLEKQQQRLRNVVFLHATNARGEVIYSSRKTTLGRNVADRDYFQRLRASAKDEMIISSPVVSCTNGRWIWLFARPINMPDGSFVGVVYAAMAIDDINKMFAQWNMTMNNSLSLRDADMRLVAGHVSPDKDVSPSDDQGLPLQLAEALKSSPQEGHYVMHAVDSNDVDRIQTYRRNDKFGFLVNLGISREVAFGGWKRQAWVTAGLVLAFAMILIVFAELVRRGWQRRDKDLAALNATQESLYEAQRIASLSSYSFDLRTGRWSGSGAVRDILGLPDDYPNDVEGWLALIAPDYREMMRNRLHETIEKLAPSEDEYPVINPLTGEERWLHHWARVKLNEKGETVKIIGTLQEITARKRAEAAQRESHEVLRSILETTTDGVWRTDRDGRLLDVNQAYCKLSGYTREELLTMRISDLEEMESAKEIAERIQYVFTHGHVQFESRHKRKDGSVWQVEVSVTYRNVDEGQTVAFMRDITERKRTQEELQQLATTDGLTGAINRRHFMHLAEREHRRAIRLEQDLTIVLIDVDDLKPVNDKYGHAGGDKVLKRLAQIFMQSIREIDVLARLGGDEFVLMLPGANLEQALDIIERCRQALPSGHNLDEGIPFTISVGIASITSDDEKLEDLMQRADQALYHSKERGRNRVSY